VTLSADSHARGPDAGLTEPPDAPLPMPVQPLTRPGAARWAAGRPPGAATIAARHVAAGLGATAAAMAGYFYLQPLASTGIGAADILRAGLIVLLTGWLAWGAAMALLGLFAPPPPRPPARPDRWRRGPSCWCRCITRMPPG
jgi:hypothetical protein